MSLIVKDTNNIACIFNNTTNSYKYTFFIGILELIKLKEFKTTILKYDELASMMVAVAWVPHCYFKLKLGNRDQTKIILDQISIPKKITSHNQLFQHIYKDKFINKIDLLEYVPHRLIRPFFSIETRGIKDSQINKLVEQLSQKYFYSDSPPLYRVDDENKQIELSENWKSYLQNNYAIVKGWAEQNWCHYLQKQNPNSPAITNKISLNINRTNLSRQRDIWLRVIDKINLRCVYTNEKIQKNFHLDHFLPWSFLAHNQIWNLIPTSPEINMRKSDSIPDEKFIAPMAQLHLELLIFMKNNLQAAQWITFISDYLDGIGLTVNQTTDHLKVEDAYKKTYTPLFQIAANNGFTPGWKYK